MNEQLQTALAAIITQATSGVEAGVSFLSQQLPDVIQQLLLWKLVVSLVWMGVGVLFFVCAIYCIYKTFRAPKRKDGKPFSGSERDAYIPTWSYNTNGQAVEYCPVFIIPILINVVAGFLCVNLDWVQIWIAPKLFLIEYAASLVK